MTIPGHVTPDVIKTGRVTNSSITNTAGKGETGVQALSRKGVSKNSESHTGGFHI